MRNITTVPVNGLKAILIPPFFHAKLKQLAAARGITMQEMVIELIKSAPRKK